MYDPICPGMPPPGLRQGGHLLNLFNRHNALLKIGASSVPHAGQSRFALRAKRFTGHANLIYP
jgi:hypothetical protein